MANSKLCFNCKPCKCKSILSLFKGRPFSRVFRFLRHRAERRRRSNRKFRSIHAVFWPLMSMRSDERDRIGEGTHTTLTETETTVRPPITIQPVTVELEQDPSPVPSSYVKLPQRVLEITSVGTEENNEMQRACKSFERYLMEMLVEEKKIRDLLDVEELMFCLDSLKSPAFVELVCTFYGELCMDLFSNGNGDEIESGNGNGSI